MIGTWINALRAILRRPPKIQAAALCIRAVHDGNINQNEVLLVRSLDSGRWILPKGWPMKGESLAGAAAIEAWEEAGVTGRIDSDAIGTFRYDKRLRGGLEEPCEAHVFVLEVVSEAGDYPEAGRRTRRWFAPQKAAQKVDDAELADLIRRFCD